MTKNTTKSGNRAEQAVAEELVRRGYKIIELNWKTPYAEIDIVAETNETMYFIEVKYRSNTDTGDGFDYITSQKLHHMRRAAETWVNKNNWTHEYELLAASVNASEDNYKIDIRPLF